MKILKYSPIIYQIIIWPFCRLLLIFFGKFEIRGVDNIKKINKKIILGSNHNSALDPIIIRTAMPWWGFHKATYAVSLTSENYDSMILKIVFSDLLSKLIGAWPGYRKTGDYKKTFKHHLKLLKNNKTIIVFPEGQRNKSNKKIKAKPGIIHLAEISNTEILPILIQGEKNMTFLSFLKRKHKIIINFGKPIKVEKLFSEIKTEENKYEKASEKIMDIIFNLRYN